MVCLIILTFCFSEYNKSIKEFPADHSNIVCHFHKSFRSQSEQQKM